LFISFSNPKLWFAAGSNRKARDFSRAFAFLSDLAGLERIVTAFGGTGFLGRRVVRHLRSHGFSVRIASRHPDRGRGRGFGEVFRNNLYWAFFAAVAAFVLVNLAGFVLLGARGLFRWVRAGYR
jgi:hypothetical protein